MKKLDLQIFRNLKQETIEYMEKIKKAEEEEILSDDEKQQFLTRYKEIVEILSKHDLSDIDFEEWKGMLLFSDNNNILDFSETHANIDFSVIEYDCNGTFTDFKSCKIRNFDFEKNSYSSEMFDEEYRKENKRYFLSEDVPENIRSLYYAHLLSLEEFEKYLPYFKGKKVAQSFSEFGNEGKIISLYGDDLYEMLSDYRPIIDKILSDYSILTTIKVPDPPITKEQRKKIMNSAVLTYIIRNGFKYIQNWNELKMILDFVPIDQLPQNPVTKELLEKYGIDGMIESGIDLKYLFKNEKLNNLQEIASINGIEFEDIKNLVDEKCRKFLDMYGINKLIESGINNLSELTEPINDLYRLRDFLKDRPRELINLGTFGEQKKEFIDRYGIDNIISLDEETGGMFSHPIRANEIYMVIFVHAEKNTPKTDKNKKPTYEEFKNRMYEILLHTRDKNGILKSESYPNYDFIQGNFRKEHPEIFIEGNIPNKVKEDFYIGQMKAEQVRQNPVLIQLLQGKDLSRVFPHNINVEIDTRVQDIEKNEIEIIQDSVNMAKYLSEKIGQENFLKICADYGKCLDNISITIKNEISIDNIRETIEQDIYDGIKTKGIEYFEELPKNFRDKHPELFLPKEVDKEIREKFYEGELSFSNIRKNPQIKELLHEKDIDVGFRNLKYEQIKLEWNNRKKR